MKKKIIILTAIILVILLSISTGMAISSHKKIENIKSAVAFTLFFELGELEEKLYSLIRDSNETDCPDAEDIERIHQSLGKINGALRTSHPIYNKRRLSFQLYPMSEGIEGVNFIAGCLSTHYSVRLNNIKVEGIFNDGVIDDNECEYIERLHSAIVELRAPLLCSDGLNFNYDFDFDLLIESVVEFLEYFSTDYRGENPAWRLLERK